MTRIDRREPLVTSGSPSGADAGADAVGEPTPAPSAVRKHFVLDTNVLLHNPNAIQLFQEHEVVIPLS